MASEGGHGTTLGGRTRDSTGSHVWNRKIINVERWGGLWVAVVAIYRSDSSSQSLHTHATVRFRDSIEINSGGLLFCVSLFVICAITELIATDGASFLMQR